MAEHKAPEIKPVKHIEYECKQSVYEHIPKLPMRTMILAPSSGGKTVLLQNMILDIYRGCFNIIYRFSPSVDIDHTWKPVKDYIANERQPHEHEQKKLIIMTPLS